MKRRTVFAIAALVAAAGCTPAAHRGSVAMKINEQEAHVCMGTGEVKAGDRVALFKNECSRPPLQAKSNPGVGRPVEAGCRQVKLGEGRVVRTLNEHYSVVEVDPGVTFEEGATVEKL
ncbi:MAG: hypothetical protein U0790_17540 [Isosphaeraceae bacterium]